MGKIAFTGTFGFHGKTNRAVAGLQSIFDFGYIFNLTADIRGVLQNFTADKSSLPVGFLPKRHLNKPIEILTSAGKILSEKKNQPKKKYEKAPEKILNSPRKIFKKWARNYLSAQEQKLKKLPSNVFSGTFIFSGKKNTEAMYLFRYSQFLRCFP